MIWSERYSSDDQPTLEEIIDFVNQDLLEEFLHYLEETYKIKPKIEYSKCSMQKGWNIKYKKGGKSLCTIYIEEGYFIVLVVIGEKESLEAEFAISTCNSYVQSLYYNTASSYHGKWLMLEVKDKSTLEDVLKLLHIRGRTKIQIQ